MDSGVFYKSTLTNEDNSPTFSRPVPANKFDVWAIWFFQSGVIQNELPRQHVHKVFYF